MSLYEYSDGELEKPSEGAASKIKAEKTKNNLTKGNTTENYNYRSAYTMMVGWVILQHFFAISRSLVSPQRAAPAPASIAGLWRRELDGNAGEPQGRPPAHVRCAAGSSSGTRTEVSTHLWRAPIAGANP
jgi:hypothetical protein